MKTVIIRGGGDIATGIGHRLFKSGFKVIILDIEKPLAIRRKVSFCQAMYSGEIVVEGVKGILSKDIDEVYENLEKGFIPVYIDEKAEIIKEIKPLVVVDSILAKKNLGTNRDMASITIGVGPGFESGKDVDLVVETSRGHFLGRVIYEGASIKNTGIPGSIMGYTEERVIRAMGNGIIENYFKIGEKIKKGEIVCKTGDVEVEAKITGVIRGLLKDGLHVKEGLKIGDIDPRGIVEYSSTISEKARAVGGGVLEAIMYLMKERGY